MTRNRDGARPRSGSARLFFALWPEAGVQEALEAFARELRAECGGRAISARNIHLTLAFLGETERALLPRLKALAATVAAPRFDLSVDYVEHWRHNHIVWAGVKQCPEALQALAAGLGAKLRAIGFKIDERPYVPHITLVRDARQAPALTRAPPVGWPVKDFVLVESVPREGVRVYEVLHRWPLAK